MPPEPTPLAIGAARRERAQTALRGEREREHERELTDLGNAERLVDEHGRDLHHVHTWSRWLAWDGRRWAVDDSGEVMRRAKDTVRGIYAEAARSTDDDRRRRIAKHAIASQADSRLR